MKIDVHTHILPENIPRFRETFGYGDWISLEHHRPCCARMIKGDEFFREVQHNCWAPHARIADCDTHDVDVQVLSTVPVMFNYWAKPKHTLMMSRVLNDHIARVVSDHPRRFVGLGTVPMQAPELAIGELERCMKQLGLRGVEIATHINEWNLDSPELFPFYEAAQDLDAAVFVHPWDMMGMDRMPNHWLPWLVAMPAETSLAICSLMMGGVIERFPKLRFMFAHGGGSFPATIGRVEHGFNVRPDLCQTRTNTSPRTLARRIYVDGLVHDPGALDLLVESIGHDRIALGTDYPFPLGELEPGRLIETSHFSAAMKERMLSGTALEWLGLERELFESDASRRHSAQLATGGL